MKLPVTTHQYCTSLPPAASDVMSLDVIFVYVLIMAGPSWASPKLALRRARPLNGLKIAGRAKNFRPVHISTINTSTAIITAIK